MPLRAPNVLAVAAVLPWLAVPGTALAADGDAPGGLQAFAGTVNAIADGSLQVQVTAVGRPGPAALTTLNGKSVAVTLSAQTRLMVTDVNADGTVSAADIAVGDQVIVSSPDALATPVTAAAVLDRTHQPPAPGDAPSTGHDQGAGAHRDDHHGRRAFPVSLLHRRLHLNAHADGFDSGVLSVTIASVRGMPARFGKATGLLADGAARVVVTPGTVVRQGGAVVTAAAVQTALAGAGDVRVDGRLLPVAKWQTAADGTKVPTLVAFRIVVRAAATPPTDDPDGPADDAPGDDTPTAPPVAN